MIKGEIDDSLSYVLINESRDISIKEQMVVNVGLVIDYVFHQ